LFKREKINDGSTFIKRDGIDSGTVGKQGFAGVGENSMNLRREGIWSAKHGSISLVE
jgi:hypothetical protein